MRVRFGGIWIADSEHRPPALRTRRSYPMAYFPEPTSLQTLWNAPITPLGIPTLGYILVHRPRRR